MKNANHKKFKAIDFFYEERGGVCDKCWDLVAEYLGALRDFLNDNSSLCAI